MSRAARDFSLRQAHSAVATIAMTIATAASGWISSILFSFPAGNRCRSFQSLADREMTSDEREIRDNVSTDELLERLAAYGVTREGLAYDCRHGYLPHPTIDVHESGRGRAGWHEPFVVHRARMLYRLRRRGCDAKTIRLILFLRDGWGWERIRRDCVTSAAKMMEISLNGLKRFAPDGGIDDFAVDFIIDHQYKWLVSKFDDAPPGLKPTSQETTRFVLGTFGTGEPIEGASAKRLSGPIAQAIWPDMGRLQRWLFCKAFDFLTVMLDLRSERMLDRIQDADPEQVRKGCWEFRLHHFLLRRVARRRSRPHTKGVCFNLITLGGQVAKIDRNDFAKCGMTMYQVFAAMVGLSIAIRVAFEEFVTTWKPALPNLMKSILSQAAPPASKN